MVRRGANEAIGDQVDEREGQPAGLESNQDSVRREWLNLSDHQRAHRKRTFLTTIVLLFARTARHIGGHRRHTADLSNGPLLRASRGHQRLRDQPGNHEDRKKTADESAKIHYFTSHSFRDLERVLPSQVRQR